MTQVEEVGKELLSLWLQQSEAEIGLLPTLNVQILNNVDRTV